MPILKLSNVAGLQHCSIRKNRVGKNDIRVVSENLFAIAEVTAKRSIEVTPLIAKAEVEVLHSCDTGNSTKPLNDKYSGVEYSEAMTVKATAAKKHII